MDDYEFGLRLVHAAGVARPHLVDPVDVEHVGGTMRPTFAALTNSLASVLAAFGALPQELRRRIAEDEA